MKRSLAVAVLSTCFVISNFFAGPAFGQQKRAITLPAEESAEGNNLATLLIKEIVRRNPEFTLRFPNYGENVPTFSKVLANFEAGDIDVIWTLASREYESEYQAVYYPLYMGMFGMRLPIVKESEINQFSRVSNLSDLQTFKAGQGTKWADTPILKSNGLPVVEVNKYFNHFPMLEGDRFDYFPRAIHEPWGEVVRESMYELTVDPHILLRYRAPFYMFVRKDDKELHEFLTKGMEDLVRTGFHLKAFMDQDAVKLALSNSNLSNRVIIDLDNPELSAQTPVEREELWFDPLSYQGAVN